MRRELVALAIMESLVALSTGIAGPIYLIYLEKIVGSERDVAIAYGLFWIAVGVLQIPSGRLCDKIGKEKMLVLGGVLASVSTFLYPFISSVTQMYALEILSGISYALESPALGSLITS